MSASPLHLSRIPANSASDAIALRGCRALGFDPMPCQRVIWFTLEARSPLGHPLHQQVVVEVPRRSGKTDGILAVAVGRCLTVPGFRVLYCAQVGLRSRARFFDTIALLGRGGMGGWKPYRARGEEAIHFDNDSGIMFGPPKADNYRGDYFDLVILDEAQEHDDEDAAQLVGALLPTFDTRPDAQLVVAGTAGESRDGLLWTALEAGRAGKTGIVEYAAPDGFDVDDETRWLDVHPGPAGVTAQRALEVLRMRHAQLPPEQFAREYLGVWPEQSVATAFPADLWHSLGVDTPPERPAKWGLAFDVTPEGDRAAVTATWRQGALVWGGVLDARPGIDWVAPYVASLAVRDRLTAWHDSTPWAHTIAAQIARDHKRVTTHATTTAEYGRACASLAAEVQAGTFRHTRQPDLDDAVAVASKRPISDGGWGWGRRKSTGSIAPLVSVSIGLLAFDSLPATRITRVLSATPR